MYLFIFHFYMVHLRPAIFPMSWVWIDGRMTLAEYQHEHGRDFERIPADELARAVQVAKAAGDEEAEKVLAREEPAPADGAASEDDHARD
jgi:hypothetical protein